jgi:hypothetical protein
LGLVFVAALDFRPDFEFRFGLAVLSSSMAIPQFFY